MPNPLLFFFLLLSADIFFSREVSPKEEEWKNMQTEKGKEKWDIRRASLCLSRNGSSSTSFVLLGRCGRVGLWVPWRIIGFNPI